MTDSYRLGIDVGSTTAKLVILSPNHSLLHSAYVRHHTRISDTVIKLLSEACDKTGNLHCSFSITGSAGIGISERAHLPFVQEVVATTEVCRMHYPDVSTLIDVGGEDSKMIFFAPDKAPDIRMNGNCAGGTGAFIDQMAGLLHTDVAQLNNLAGNSNTLYPIASRCGVFAKTDIQNLLSRKIAPEDIAASVFHAVAIQSLNTLARGTNVKPKLLFIGGPFRFLPNLCKAFARVLGVAPNDILVPENAEFFPAIGAAIHSAESAPIYLEELIARLKNKSTEGTKQAARLTPLFESPEEKAQWESGRNILLLQQHELSAHKGNAFLGIDSGSTTSKIVLIDENSRLLFQDYRPNKGRAVEAIGQGLERLFNEIEDKSLKINIVSSAVTGYGEDLIKAAFGIGHGIVETIAHFTAACHVNPQVSFILDIGGQDMKAIYVQNGTISRLELNESCSSGCGSFVESFGNSLHYSAAEFARIACEAKAPCDLGTRCTVFMNSKVKQSLREDANVSDIAAGLCLSVIKNALFKVLKIKNFDRLGQNIVVQGGTFKNQAVWRALEQLTQRKVSGTDFPELMGAFGAALYARKMYEKTDKQPANFSRQQLQTAFSSTTSLCKGCENNCTITRFTFAGGKTFYSGNKCEKVFTNRGQSVQQGQNLVTWKYNLLFDRKPAENGSIRLGIPRVLGMYENYPFWHELFTSCGIEVVLSSVSTQNIYEKGLGTIMSDSICFPAKIVHGHIIALIEQRVDRIFYPFTVYEQQEYAQSDNSYNCPIVSSYSEVISSSINPERRAGIRFDSPTVNMADESLLRKACYAYLEQLGIERRKARKAFVKALEAQRTFKAAVREKGAELIAKAKNDKQLLIVLAGRPYHSDPLINHKTDRILQDMGVHIITEDAVPLMNPDEFSGLQIISQWAFPNRIYNAALWTARQNDRVQMVQINSFGCGPDAIVIDECNEVLNAAGKNLTVIRVDEISATGSVRLRLRSLVESIVIKHSPQQPAERKATRIFDEEQKHRIILAPRFSHIYSTFLPALFELGGYNLINLPEPDHESVQFGLKYANNEICYPATIIVGDLMKALASGKYQRDQIAVGITQTGGQCRASSYLSIIKKAMISAGFDDIPIISVGTSGKTINPQPGFNMPWKSLLPITFVTMLYADALAKMFHAGRAREKTQGQARKILDTFLHKGQSAMRKKDIAGIYTLLKQAVNAFNAVEIKAEQVPQVGIVGEIYVKYNSFGHHYIVDWLVEQGVEPVIPPLLDFFIQDFVNLKANSRANLSTTPLTTNLLVAYFETSARRHINRTNKILAGYRFVQPFHYIKNIAAEASEVIHLANQYGEGWLIPAEIAAFAHSGVNNVISLQPFGCIANHIISKGIEKRIRDKYPQMNLLFLDFDESTSGANILNRLHFMVKNAKSHLNDIP